MASAMPPTRRSTLYVAVFGAGLPHEDTDPIAEEVGRYLAEAGAVLVCGGMTGVMEAACRGAKQAGGITVGILPGLERSDANDYVDVAIPTGLGEMRNSLIVRAADSAIAVGGEFGTLSEIALALKTGVPVVGLSTWGLTKAGEEVPAIEVAGDPAEAVEKALAAAGR